MIIQTEHHVIVKKNIAICFSTKLTYLAAITNQSGNRAKIVTLTKCRPTSAVVYRCIGVTHFKVMGSCCVTPCATTSNIAERITDLKSVAGNDGIHFTAAAYQNLANRTIGCLKTSLVSPNKTSRQRATARYTYGSTDLQSF